MVPVYCILVSISLYSDLRYISAPFSSQRVDFNSFIPLAIPSHQPLSPQPFLSISDWSLYMPLNQGNCILFCSVKNCKRLSKCSHGIFQRLWLSFVPRCFYFHTKHVLSFIFSLSSSWSKSGFTQIRCLPTEGI